MERERFYRDWMNSAGLIKFTASVEETDLCVMAKKDLTPWTLELIRKYRKEITDYIEMDPAFKYSMKPLKIRDGASPMVERMLLAAKVAGVGPMAAVAGAMAEFIGMDLLSQSDELIVENGGDIFIKCLKDKKFGIYAGDSPLTGKLTFEIIAKDTPLGVCTSSGSVGHSLSLGKADAACIISKDTALADAMATRTGNIVQSPEDIEKAIDFARSVEDIAGVIIVAGDKVGSWGNIRLNT